MNTTHDEQGFSYIDVMIAIVILMVGVLALASALTLAVVRSREAEQQLIAKQYAFSALEQVFTARDMSTFGWDYIRNVAYDSTEKGFAKNGTSGLDMKKNAGADRVFGTPDDSGDIIPGFQRRIIITDLCDPDRPSANCVPCATLNPAPNCAPVGNNPVMMRRVDVTIWYQVNNARRTENASTIITDY